MCFPPNLSSCIIKLLFRIVDLVNFIFNFRFLSLLVWKFLSNSLFDFVDSSLSSLSKSIKMLISHLNLSSDLIKFQKIPHKYFNSLWI